MTEDSWRLTTRRAATMFGYVALRLSPRKVHLIGAAVYRLVWPPGDDVEIVERYADGLADEAVFIAARAELFPPLPPPFDAFDNRGAAGALQLLFNLDLQDSVQVLVARSLQGSKRQTRERRAAVCDLIREIAGNPFRPWKSIPEAMGGGLVQPDGATVFPSAAARAIAAGVAADQAFDRLPVLADALEDSGVTDAELLAHCRRPGGHLRGCWAVDVVLGRG